MIYLRSILFIVGMIVSLLALFPTAFVARALPRVSGYFWWTLWARFVIWWLGISCNLWVDVRGRENIAKGQQYLFMPNHQSEWETFACQVFLPPLVFILKQELFRIPVFGWALRLTRPISIDRARGREALRQVANESATVFEEGCSVLIYPEGTRQPYGRLGRFLPGGAFIAQQTGIPIIPIALDAGYYWRKNSFLKYPGTIQFRIGEPIETKDKTTRQIQQESRDAIEGLMNSILRDTGQQTLPD